MAPQDWQDPELRSLGLMLADDGAALLLLLNAAAGPCRFVLPGLAGLGGWRVLLDTVRPDDPPSPATESLSLSDRSLALLECQASSSTGSLTRARALHQDRGVDSGHAVMVAGDRADQIAGSAPRCRGRA